MFIMSKVLHISTLPKSGGAARASYRLHQGLLLRGIDSQIFAQQGDPQAEEVKVFKPAKDWKTKVQRNIFHRTQTNINQKYPNRPQGLELFTSDQTPYRNDLLSQLPASDIFHLHWVSRFLDISAFFNWVEKPVVWTLHDMNVFTGGCHYDNLCGKYATSCGACPQLGSHNNNDWSKEIFERKRKAIARIPAELFRVVADSYWLAGEARKSPIFEGKSVETIHYGLDHELFKPKDKQSVRKLLEIPEGKKVFLFGAPGVTNKRKGFQELLYAIQVLTRKRKDLFLLSFGGGKPPIDADVPHLHLGSIDNDMFLSWVYNAADVFVIPSLQEAFGQTCLEAMACAVPCAGFNTGGIPDMIKEGETGHLAQAGNAEALAMAMEKTLANKEELGRNARLMVESKFTLQHQAENYIKLYGEMLNR